MADYVLPDVVEKRVRYFDGQFLQDQDFVDEQDYQLDREHRHNRLLHGPGIVEGLTVTASAANQVSVAPGTAVDADGQQLVLAQATTVNLPGAEFNDKHGVQLYLSYLATAADEQTVSGSSDYTRWLERPQLTAVGPGSQYAGTAPPVLLARLSLDNIGDVTVDGSVRAYSGVLLPGSGPDPVALRTAGGGAARLSGALTVDGHVGIAQPSPVNDLEVGNYDGQDRFIALKVAGGNQHVSGLKFWTWQENYGYSIMYDERQATGNGLHISAHNVDPNGTTRLFVGWNGNVGIGTTGPAAALEVAGAGGSSVDLQVNGRMRSNNNDGGLWVAQDRFVGGFDTSKIGFFNGGAWRLAVLPGGQVGIAQPSPVNDLEVGNYDGQDRFIALKVAGGNQHVSGLKFWTWQENYGYSIMYDERQATGNGLHVKTHNKDPNGTTQLFVGWGGNIGMGTQSPAAKLDVVGGGNTSVDLQVNGRMRSNNNDGGLWVAQDRFVGGFDTDKIGFYNGGAWRLAVLSNGQVGIGTTTTNGMALKVQGGAWIDGPVYATNGLLLRDGSGNWHGLGSRTVGIGDPTQWLFIGGGASAPSDLRLKTDLRPVSHALDQVRQLQAVRYRWGADGLAYLTRDVAETACAGPGASEAEHEQARQEQVNAAAAVLAGDRVGLIAQDVEAVLPELVQTDASGYRHVRYQHLTALLAEAIKELSARVDALGGNS